MSLRHLVWSLAFLLSSQCSAQISAQQSSWQLVSGPQPASTAPAVFSVEAGRVYRLELVTSSILSVYAVAYPSQAGVLTCSPAGFGLTAALAPNGLAWQTASWRCAVRPDDSADMANGGWYVQAMYWTSLVALSFFGYATGARDV